jgi:integral membrane sensor domain MASE1
MSSVVRFLAISAARIFSHRAWLCLLVVCAVIALPAQTQDPSRQDEPAPASVKDFSDGSDAAQRNGFEITFPPVERAPGGKREMPWAVKVKTLTRIGIFVALGAFAAGVAAGAKVVAQLILGTWFMMGGLYSIAFIASSKGTAKFTTMAIGLVAVGFVVGHRPNWRRSLRGSGSDGSSWMVFGTGSLRYVVQLATVTLACVFADRLSTWAVPIFDFFNPRARPFPPQPDALYATSLSAGVATGALLVIGARVWPAIAVAAFMGTVSPPGFVAVGPVLIMAMGHTLGSLTCWWLANRYANGFRSFPRVGSVLRLTACALVSASVVALFSILTRLAGWEVVSPWRFPTLVGQSENGLVTFLRIFVGIILVAPVITLWSTGAPWHRLFRRAREFVVVLVVTGVTAWWVFGNSAVGKSHYPIPFLVLPVLLWPAFRLGVRETATASLVLAVLALTGSGIGYGPFVRGSTMETLLLVQIFLVVCALGALAVAAEVGRRETVEGEVRALYEDLEGRASARAQELVRAHAELRRTRRRPAPCTGWGRPLIGAARAPATPPRCVAYARASRPTSMTASAPAFPASRF